MTSTDGSSPLFPVRSAPMPYVIGVHTSLLEKMCKAELDDVIVLNIDDESLEDPHCDRQKLPPDAV